MARIHVTDAVWAEFRAASGPIPIGVFLGRLVEREVDRYRSRRLRAGTLDDHEVVEALERARNLHGDIAAVVARLEQRLAPGSPSAGEPVKPEFR